MQLFNVVLQDNLSFLNLFQILKYTQNRFLMVLDI